MLRFLCCCSILFSAALLPAQHTDIHGVITDLQGDTLVGAYVKVIGSVVGDVTDVNGAYEVEVPTGRVRLLFSYVGYENYDTTFRATLKEEDIRIDVRLAPAEFSGPAVVVLGRRATGQLQALRIQREAAAQVSVVHADLFNKYPDVSLAETVQRIPGVTVSRRQGEAEFVQLRGIPEELTLVSLNGQRLPSLRAEANRASSLDLIQTNLVEEVYVNKARTADQEADAIGGSIDFRLRQPRERLEALFQGGLGRNFQDSPLRGIDRGVQQLSGYLNAELSEEKIFALAAGSYFRNGRNTDQRLLQYAPDAPVSPLLRPELYRPADVDRVAEKIGLVGAIELRPSVYNRLRLSYNFSRSNDAFVSRSQEVSTSNFLDLRETANWREEREVSLLALEVENRFDRLTLDYSLSLARSNDRLPERTLIRSQVNPRTEAPASAELSASTDRGTGENGLAFINFERLALRENIANGKLNLTLFTDDLRTTYFKAGVNYRVKDRIFGFAAFDKVPTVVLNDFHGGQQYVRENYILQADFPGLNPTDVAELDAARSANLLEDEASYESEEEVLAGYLMYYRQWTANLSTSVGLRYEETEIEFRNLENRADSSQFNYGNLFPSLNITYRTAPKRQFRLSYHEAIGRPGYGQVGNFVQPLSANRALLVGNAEVRQTISRNFDLAFERYGQRDGLFAVATYLKLLNDPFVRSATFEERSGGRQFLRTTIENAESAVLWGAELAFYQNFNFIGPAFRYVNLNATYNFNISRVSSTDPAQDGLPLASSPRNSANLSLVYDNPAQRLTLVAAGNFRNQTLIQVIDARPIYRGGIFTLDLAADYELFDRFTIYGRWNNLTNPVIRDQVQQANDALVLFSSEQFGAWAVAGLRWRL